MVSPEVPKSQPNGETGNSKFTYHFRFLPCFIGMCLLCFAAFCLTGVFTLSLLFFLGYDPLANPVAVVGKFGLGALICIFACFFLYLKKRKGLYIEISDKGIHGLDIWGRLKIMAWQDINSIKRFNLYKWKFIRIFAEKDKYPLWLPLDGKGEIKKALVRFDPNSSIF